MTLVHAIGDIRPGDTGFLWIPACPAAQGICTRDESAVTCRNCLTMQNFVSAPQKKTLDSMASRMPCI